MRDANSMAKPDDQQAAWLAVDQVGCDIDGVPVVHDAHFVLARGQLGALLGPSGSGKSTLLRAIAGLRPVSRGRVLLRGTAVSTPDCVLAPEKRRIGVVFQDLALFPHLDVAGNVGFGLGPAERNSRSGRVAALLERFEIDALAKRLPHELSGGQQQRVAIARALAPEPDLLLLDEPFSSLDADLRERLRVEIARNLRALNVTALLVTHDHSEALGFADRVGVLIEGNLRQWADPRTVFEQPADADVAAFVGEGILLDAVTAASGALCTEVGLLEPAGGRPPAGESRRVLVRPHELAVAVADDGVSVRVVRADYAGAESRLEIETERGLRMPMCWRGAAVPAVGQALRIAARTGAYPHYPPGKGSKPPSSR